MPTDVDALLAKTAYAAQGEQPRSAYDEVQSVLDSTAYAAAAPATQPAPRPTAVDLTVRESAALAGRPGQGAFNFLLPESPSWAPGAELRDDIRRGVFAEMQRKRDAEDVRRLVKEWPKDRSQNELREIMRQFKAREVTLQQETQKDLGDTGSMMVASLSGMADDYIKALPYRIIGLSLQTLGVPGASRVAGSYGLLKSLYDDGYGQISKDLLAEGYDLEVVRKVAPWFASVNAAAEGMWDIAAGLPGMKTIGAHIKPKIFNAAKKTLANIGLQRLADGLGENTENWVQAVAEGTAREVAHDLQRDGVNSATAKSIAEAMVQTVTGQSETFLRDVEKAKGSGLTPPQTPWQQTKSAIVGTFGVTGLLGIFPTFQQMRAGKQLQAQVPIEKHGPVALPLDEYLNPDRAGSVHQSLRAQVDANGRPLEVPPWEANKDKDAASPEEDNFRSVIEKPSAFGVLSDADIPRFMSYYPVLGDDFARVLSRAVKAEQKAKAAHVRVDIGGGNAPQARAPAESYGQQAPHSPQPEAFLPQAAAMPFPGGVAEPAIPLSPVMPEQPQLQSPEMAAALPHSPAPIPGAIPVQVPMEGLPDAGAIRVDQALTPPQGAVGEGGQVPGSQDLQRNAQAGVGATGPELGQAAPAAIPVAAPPVEPAPPAAQPSPAPAATPASPAAAEAKAPRANGQKKTTIAGMFKASGHTLKKSPKFDSTAEYEATVNGKKFRVSAQYNPEGGRWWYRPAHGGKWMRAGDYHDEVVATLEKAAGMTPRAEPPAARQIGQSTPQGEPAAPEKPVAVPAPTLQREPWQMTLSEFRDENPDFSRPREYHHDQVRFARQRGLPVPERVREEYPDVDAELAAESRMEEVEPEAGAEARPEALPAPEAVGPEFLAGPALEEGVLDDADPNEQVAAYHSAKGTITVARTAEGERYFQVTGADDRVIGEGEGRNLKTLKQAVARLRALEAGQLGVTGKVFAPEATEAGPAPTITVPKGAAKYKAYDADALERVIAESGMSEKQAEHARNLQKNHGLAPAGLAAMLKNWSKITDDDKAWAAKPKDTPAVGAPSMATSDTPDGSGAGKYNEIPVASGWIRAAAARMSSRLAAMVHVLDAVPEDVAATAAAYGMKGTMKGYTTADHKRVLIFPQALRNHVDAIGTLLHEAVHLGGKVAFGEERWNKLLKTIYPQLSLRTVTSIAKSHGYDQYTPEGRLKIAEEALGIMREYNIGTPNLMLRAVSMVRRWMREFGLTHEQAANWSAADIASLLHDAVRPFADPAAAERLMGEAAGYDAKAKPAMPQSQAAAGSTVTQGQPGTAGQGEVGKPAMATPTKMLFRSGIEDRLLHTPKGEPVIGPARLAPGDEKVLAKARKKLPPKVYDRLVSNVQEYRASHSQKGGWAPLVLKGWEKGTSTAVWEEVPWDLQKYSVKTLADRLERDISGLIKAARSGRRDAQEIIERTRWYIEAQDLMFRQFGPSAYMMGDLIGALSPGTAVRQNAIDAVDVLRRFMDGDFDDIIMQYAEHVAAGNDPNKYYGPIPRRGSGKQYAVMGTEINLLKAMVQVYSRLEAGRQPKTLFFAANVLGRLKDRDLATIDMWVGRALRRLAGQSRIPPMAEDGVSGVLDADLLPTRDYGHAQQVLQTVEGRFPDLAKLVGLKRLQAKEIQALVWTMEKALWKRNGWLRREVDEGGSLQVELGARMPAERVIQGMSIATGDFVPADEDQRLAGAVMEAALNNAPGVVFGTVNSGSGRWTADGKLYQDERAINSDALILKNSNHDLIIQAAVHMVKRTKQDALLHMRMLAPGEKHPNARPGLEVVFAEPVPASQLGALLGLASKHNIVAFTMVGDPVARDTRYAHPKAYIGFRAVSVPEYDDSLRSRIAAIRAEPGKDEAKQTRQIDALISAYMKADTAKYSEFLKELRTRTAVGAADLRSYDVLMIRNNQYDAYLAKLAAGLESGKDGPGYGGSHVWLARSIRERIEQPDVDIQPAAEPGVGADVQPASTEAEGAAGVRGRDEGRFALRRNDDGTVEFRHWSRQPGLTALDPAYHGTGIADEARKRAMQPGYLPRIYFGGESYQKEPALGPHEYRGRIDPSRLYDIDADPLDLWEKTRVATAWRGDEPVHWRYNPTAFERAVKEAGFAGAYKPSVDVGYLFEKTAVAPAPTPAVGSPAMAGGDPMPELDFRNPQHRQTAAAFAGATEQEAEAAYKAWIERGTDSPWFRKWFGNSKVVTETGAPSVQYHYTTKLDKFGEPFFYFDEDKSDFAPHFGTLGQAGDVSEINWSLMTKGAATAAAERTPYGRVGYDDVVSQTSTPEAPDRIYPVYLSIQNPVRLKDNSSYGSWNAAEVATQLADAGIITQDMADDYAARSLRRDNERPVRAELRRLLVDKGYDGIVYLNRNEDVGVRKAPIKDITGLSDEDFSAKYPEARDSWMPLSRDQVKSATGNIGLFTEGQDDIRLAMQRDDIAASITGLFSGNRASKILMDAPGIASGPFDGGCLVVAKAIAAQFKGAGLVRLDHNGTPDHYGAEIPGVGIADAGGVYPSPGEWIDAFKENAGTDWALTFARGYKETPDGPLDDGRTVRKLIPLLEEALSGIGQAAIQRDPNAPLPLARQARAGQEMRGFPERMRGLGLFRPYAERITEDPENWYYQQSIRDASEKVAGMTQAERRGYIDDLAAKLEKDSPDNIGVLAGMQYLVDGIGTDDADALAQLSRIAKVGTAMGQLVRQFAELKAASPVAYVRIMEKLLKKSGRFLRDEQRAELEAMVAADIEARRNYRAAEEAYLADPNSATAQAADDAAKVAVDALRAVVRRTSAHVPLSMRQILTMMLQGNLLTPKSQIANIVGNAVFVPLRGGYQTFAGMGDMLYSTATGTERSVLAPGPGALKHRAVGMAKGFAHELAAVLKGEPGEAVAGEIRQEFHPIEALRDFWKAVPALMPVDETGKVPAADRVKKFLEGTGGIMPASMFAGLRLMDASFREGQRFAGLYEQGRKAGLKGVELEEFVTNGAAEMALRRRGIKGTAQPAIAGQPLARLLPTAQEIKLVEEEARQSVFQQRNLVADSLSQLIRAMGDAIEQFPVAGPALSVIPRTVVPYIQTPMNLTWEGLQYVSPELSVMMGMTHAYHGDRRKALQAFAKAIVGGIMVAGAQFLYRLGVLSGDPNKIRKRAEMAWATLAPNSVNLSGLRRGIEAWAKQLGGEDVDPGVEAKWREGDEIVGYKDLGFTGIVMNVIANHNDELMAQREEKGERAEPKDAPAYMSSLKYVPQIGKAAVNLAAMKGTADFLVAMQKGEDGVRRWWGRYMQTISALPVPNTAAALNRARQVYIHRLPEADNLKDAFVEAMKEKLFMTDSMPVRRDFFGRPIPRTPEGANRWWYNLFSVTKGHEIPRDPLIREVWKVYEATRDSDVIPSVPDKTVEMRGKKYTLTDRQYDTYLERVGAIRQERLNRALSDAYYQNAAPEWKAKRLAAIWKVPSHLAARDLVD